MVNMAPSLDSNIKVLLVDDHQVVREGLRTMLADEPDIRLVGEASCGEEAVRATDDMEPDVVLMDVRMPGMGGMEATRLIKSSHPTTSVIMVTMYDNEMYVVESLRAGAAGYLTKDSSRDLLCHAIRAAVDGGTLVRSELLGRALQSPPLTAKSAGNGGDTSLLECLTPRELEVLTLLAQGHRNKDLCAQLNVAEVTVKKHVQNIIGKLGVSDRTHAAVLAVRLGLGG